MKLTGKLGELAGQYPELLRATGVQVHYPQFVVTARKIERGTESDGLYVFGPFNSEAEAQGFMTKVIEHPNWSAEEVPALNGPEVFGTGDERL